MAAFLFVVTIPLEQEGDQLSPIKEDEGNIEKNSEEQQNGDVLSEQDQGKAVKEAGVSPSGAKNDTESTVASDADGQQEGNGKENTNSFDRSSTLTSECESFTLEEAVQALLAILDIERELWQKSDSSGYSQVSFIVETCRVDVVLKRLTLLGIGRIPDTSVTLFPAQSHFVGLENVETKSSEDQSSSEEVSKTSEFYKSVKARLTVAQVVAGVSANAKLTFDHLMLIVLASIIAALGLSENSSVVLVASMLISPLMGPILGFTFGIVVENQVLWKMSLRNSGIGLLMCVVMGFFIGLITGAAHIQADWGGDISYPTPEMSSRGLYHGLMAGVLIALASGIGVALAVLGGNTASLVGAAISASLLPPAVNAGMLWALSLLMSGHHPVGPVEMTMPGNDTNITQPERIQVALRPGNCTPYPGNSYVFHYDCRMSVEAFYLGGVSLCLTILNIICIFITGFAILKLKEVLPHTAVSEGTEMFWKKDIKIARDAYRTLKGKECLNLAKYAKDLAQETKRKSLPGASKTYHGLDGEEFYKDFLEDLERSEQYQDIVQRIPNNKRISLLQQVSMDDQYYTAPTSPEDFFNESSPILTPDLGYTPGARRRGRPVLQRTTFGNTHAAVLLPGYRQRRSEPQTPFVGLEDVRLLFEGEPSKDESRNVTMEYSVPRQRKKSGRRRLIQRMPSAPSRVRVVTAPTNQKSRFKVTVIKEEEQ